jgi:transposase-like protein
MAEGKDFQYLDFEGLSRWACCLCVVTFDLELGQSMEVRFPKVGTVVYTLEAVDL